MRRSASLLLAALAMAAVPLVAGGKIAGRVVLPAGILWSGLSIGRGGVRLAFPAVEEDGRFSAGGLPPGPCRVRFWCEADGRMFAAAADVGMGERVTLVPKPR